LQSAEYPYKGRRTCQRTDVRAEIVRGEERALRKAKLHKRHASNKSVGKKKDQPPTASQYRAWDLALQTRHRFYCEPGERHRLGRGKGKKEGGKRHEISEEIWNSKCKAGTNSTRLTRYSDRKTRREKRKKKVCLLRALNASCEPVKKERAS